MARKETRKHKKPPYSASFTNYTSSTRRSSIPPDPAEMAQLQHAQDMHGFWVGPMPKATKSLFRNLTFDAKESICHPFMNRIGKTPKLIPGFKVVSTSEHAAAATRKKIRLNPTGYHGEVGLTKSTTQFECMELHFEFKRNNTEDPFEDPQEELSEEERSGFDIEPEAKERMRCRGQICSYVIEWMSRQHRLFAFTIYIGHPWARFIRWDRAGAVVTEKFNYVEDARPLNKFLWRFVHVNDARRGLDPTVRYADPDEIRLAKTHLTEWQPSENNPLPILVMTVPVVDEKGREGNREFIVWGSLSIPDSITGRATRGYPALETKTEECCFLKDNWRAECVEPESRILKLLQEKRVRNVPPFLCGGDLPAPMHQTLTDLYAQSAYEGTEERILTYTWLCGRNFIRVTRRIHHRFVVNFIGKKLTQFKSSRQLLQVTLDAFIAHQDAYEKAGVLHRDISINNILISREGVHGVLIDWDLATVLNDKEGKVPRKHELTGTWQFISTLLLKYPNKTHTVQDDMESFIHVVLYAALLHLPHNKEDDLHSIITQVFDFHYVDKGKDIGGNGKKLMILDRDHIGWDFQFTNNYHFDSWLDFALDGAKAWIQYKESENAIRDPKKNANKARYDGFIPPPREPAQLEPPSFFSSHTQFRNMWTSILNANDPAWPENDWREDPLKKLTLDILSDPSWKRCREVDDVTERSVRRRS